MFPQPWKNVLWGADSIRPNPRISGSTQVNVHATVGVDEYVDPAQSTPKERFVLRAAGSRPYGSDGKAGSIQRTAHLRELRVDY